MGSSIPDFNRIDFAVRVYIKARANNVKNKDTNHLCKRIAIDSYNIQN